MSKKVITPMQIIAADSNSRTISGRIVTFEETGNASIGKVQFAQGSIEPTSVLLNLEHDRTRRIGKTLSIYATKQGIDATFKIAETTAGNDALVEAQEGLRDGFSVEVMFDEYETMNDGTVRILKGELTGVALTSEPAIRSARVESVAATEEDQISDSTIEPESTTTEGDEVEDTVKDASTAETVEAAQSVTAAAKPAALANPLDSQRVRTPIVNKATYLEHSVRATLGNEQSKLYVAAAADTTDNAGLVPTRQLTEVINGISNADRPSNRSPFSVYRPKVHRLFPALLRRVGTLHQRNLASLQHRSKDLVGFAHWDAKLPQNLPPCDNSFLLRLGNDERKDPTPLLSCMIASTDLPASVLEELRRRNLNNLTTPVGSRSVDDGCLLISATSIEHG